MLLLQRHLLGQFFGIGGRGGLVRQRCARQIGQFLLINRVFLGLGLDVFAEQEKRHQLVHLVIVRRDFLGFPWIIPRLGLLPLLGE